MFRLIFRDIKEKLSKYKIKFIDFSLITIILIGIIALFCMLEIKSEKNLFYILDMKCDSDGNNCEVIVEDYKLQQHKIKLKDGKDLRKPFRERTPVNRRYLESL